MTEPARPLRADAARNRARVLEVAYNTFAAEGLAVPIDEIAPVSARGPYTGISPPRRISSGRW
jgi:hypothetical protein